MYSLPHHSVGFRFSSDLSLLTLKGIGLHYIDSHDYSWNNRTRKDEHCLLQFCIDGEGSLEIDGITYSILPGDAFLIATAMKYGLAVITEENPDKPTKIPQICKKYGLQAMNITKLCEVEGWKF